jgi:hypothetical protein
MKKGEKAIRRLIGLKIAKTIRPRYLIFHGGFRGGTEGHK